MRNPYPSGADWSPPGQGDEPRRDPGGLVDQLRVLRYDTLFPVARWLQDRPWDLPWVRGLLFLALCPVALGLFFQGSRDPRDAAWALGLYFSLLWGVVLYWVLAPRRVVVAQIVGVALFTAFVGMAVLLVIQRLPPFNLLYLGTQTRLPLAQLVGFIFGVGVLEELTKAVPVIWLALKLGRVRTPRQAAFLGGVSGLAFGVAEAANYSWTYALGNYYGRLGYGEYVLVEALRLISAPFLHCVWAAIVGYYVGLAMLARREAVALVVVGIGTAATLHGLYDFLAGGWLCLVVFAVSVLLFVSYARSADAISAALGQQSGRGDVPRLERPAADSPP
ncbi:MAG TPA: PrsW family glutamic-type intramembrane protease [Chloroflexota bacterium]|jgi:RsiW-degrading membrane proteinase PrsW (M82 family)